MVQAQRQPGIGSRVRVSKPRQRLAAQPRLLSDCVMKLYGNLILAATICVVIFWIIMALRPAHAASRVVVGKPTVIQSALLPPPKYDKPYDGELEIRFFRTPQTCNELAPIVAATPDALRFRLITSAVGCPSQPKISQRAKAEISRSCYATNLRTATAGSTQTQRRGKSST